MNLDMMQFVATQNQKRVQARTLLWGKYTREINVRGQFTPMKMTATSRGFPDEENCGR